MPKRVSIFGATGSVGRSTVELVGGLVGARAEAFVVEAVTGGRNVALLCEQAKRLRAKVAVIEDASLYGELRDGLAGSGIEAAAGGSALREAASRPAEWSMFAIVGMACLAPALEAVARGGCIAMANKECLVAAGKLFMEAARASGAVLLPVDSEHNAIFQLFEPARAGEVEEVVLTASGGPFLGWEKAALREVTPEQAARHPNWSMGAKISIDSATLMNKGLELVEARWLFAEVRDKFRVVIHPQSIVHALVGWRDGSVSAYLSAPDMRVPIAHALSCVEGGGAVPFVGERLDVAAVGRLDFAEAGEGEYPALGLARRVLERDDGAATLLNAANEEAVAAFLGGRIGFLDIVPLVASVLDVGVAEASGSPGTLDEALFLDGVGRQLARERFAGGF